MSKFIAIFLVVFFPVHLAGMVISVFFEAVNDSRLYSLSMFIESCKFHYKEHPLNLKEYGVLIKDFWNNEYTT